ncbi:MAG: hypothetical protein GDA43_22290 [Hormoscilla sp. SP5CHS1]|nr:hypothetical protein [Hormoscilla sp. SP5CHS1]
MPLEPVSTDRDADVRTTAGEGGWDASSYRAPVEEGSDNSEKFILISKGDIRRRD